MVKVTQNGHSPDFVSPLGETIAAKLDALEMTSSELANLMGYPLWAIQTIISGEAIITPKTATLLEQALGNPANVPSNRGYGYEEFLAVNPIRSVRNEWHPDFVTPLGDTLEETLEAKEMTRADLASRMGYPLATINAIIAATLEVTPEIASKLEQALGVSATFWNNRERRYREWVARQTGSVAIAA